ncbi:SGNH/GDSL hydrolase family protein [Methylotenera sp.]|uniref:SGNH/GDSL hydrolase family protein n=1 Tax=Methylotenera sp. TaxID=2051956 RepID=UPI002489ACE0|nr:SGNH/GDSL hydrolase family protein [Methylotenera sp.]MDI1362498.1 SGNH/GDSL hydrolase family protein [Methylotenera sp.]
MTPIPAGSVVTPSGPVDWVYGPGGVLIGSISPSGDYVALGGSTKTSRLRAITVGDSHLNNGFLSNGAAQMVSFIVANGIATVVNQSGFPHYLTPNSSFTLFNNSDLTYTSTLNGCCLKVLTTPDNLTFTFPATYNGKTLPDGNYSSQSWYFILYQTHLLDNSWYQWLNNFLGRKLVTVANYALGGSISAKDVAILPNILVGPDFDIAFITTGTNDINGVSTLAAALAAADTVYANTKKLTDTFTALGKYCVVTIPPPIGAAAQAGFTQPKNIALASLRNRLLNLGRSNHLIDTADAFGVCINGTSTNGDFLTGYTWANVADSVHLAVFAQIKLVKNFLATTKFTALFKPQFNSPVTVLEDATGYPQTESNANLQVNGLMTGAVAVGAVTGVTGTKPTGWTPQAASGSSTHVLAGGAARYSKPNSNSANQGLAATLVSTWSGTASDTFVSWLPNFSANMVGGKWYKYSIDVTNIGGATITNVGNITFQVYLNNIINMFANRSLGNNVSNGVPLDAGDTITISTEAFYVPAGVNFGSLCIAMVQVSGNTTTGTSSLEFTSAQMRVVDDPLA